MDFANEEEELNYIFREMNGPPVPEAQEDEAMAVVDQSFDNDSGVEVDSQWERQQGQEGQGQHQLQLYSQNVPFISSPEERGRYCWDSSSIGGGGNGNNLFFHSPMMTSVAAVKNFDLGHGGTPPMQQPTMMTFGQALGGGGGAYQGQPNQKQQMGNFWEWGQQSASPTDSTGFGGVKKRNAAEAELGEYSEVGTNFDDLEIGHNAPKIRTMDFDEAATMTKSGYVIDEAFLKFEQMKKQMEDKWDEPTPSGAAASVIQPQPLKTALKDLNFGNKPIKFAKRRTGRCNNDENWEEDIRLTSFVRFGNKDDLWGDD